MSLGIEYRNRKRPRTACNSSEARKLSGMVTIGEVGKSGGVDRIKSHHMLISTKRWTAESDLL